MNLIKTVPKLLAALTVLLFGPFLGVLIGLILALLALSADQNFVRNGARAAPGDGFLIILYIAISLLISIPISIFGAGLLLFKSRNQDLQQTSANGT